LVHPRDGGAAVGIKHCLSVLASMWLHYVGARANWKQAALLTACTELFPYIAVNA